MKQNTIKQYIPNALSLMRVTFAFAMYFFAKRSMAVFLPLYITAGVSDTLDGFLARRWGVSSKLGALLDDAGDISFFTSAFINFARLVKIERGIPFALSGFAVALSFKLVSLVYTRVTFKQWGSIHTFLCKGLGAVCFFTIAICIFLGRLPLPLLVFAVSWGVLAFAEECLIAMRIREYRTDCPSIFAVNKQ